MTKDEPFYIGIGEVISENEDGSATYEIHMSDDARDKLTELGIQFIMHCAASEMDIQDAFKMILGETTDDS